MDQILEVLSWAVVNPAKIVLGLEFLVFFWIAGLIGERWNIRIPYGEVFLRMLLVGIVFIASSVFFDILFELPDDWMIAMSAGSALLAYCLQRPWRW